MFTFLLSFCWRFADQNQRLLKTAEQTACSHLLVPSNELQIGSKRSKMCWSSGPHRLLNTLGMLKLVFCILARCQQSNIFIALKRVANNFCFGSWGGTGQDKHLEPVEARAASGNHVAAIC